MKHAMSLRLVEGGPSEGCRSKLPRWPFSGSGGTRATGTAVHGSMVGSHTRRVKFFVSCHAFLEHHGPRALWWPCSHPHFPWRSPASLTAAPCHVCLCLSVCHRVDVQRKMNGLKRKKGDFGDNAPPVAATQLSRPHPVQKLPCHPPTRHSFLD
jgi:hypothetical protein